MSATSELLPPPPPPPSAPPSPIVRDRAPGRLAALSVGAGLTLELGLRGGLANVIVVGGVLLAVALLVTDRRLASPGAQRCAIAAAVPAAFLGLRASPWLAWSNSLAIAGLLLLAVGFSRSGSIADAAPAQAVVRSLAALGRIDVVVPVLRPLVPAVSSDTTRTVRRTAGALALAIPTLGVLVALLAAADPVFAGLLLPDVDGAALLGHVSLWLAITVIVAGITAAALGDAEIERTPGTFGVVEVTTVLALAAVVLGLFVLSQLVATTDAGRRLVESAGLTPAEYARSGFFQLCWATAVLLGFLAVVRRLGGPATRSAAPVRILSAAVPVLALGLVAVSLRRMALYDEAFGLTMLRVWVIGAAIWMGVVLVLLAVRNLGVGGGREWVLCGALICAVGLVVAADVVDVEAFVVRHNVGRATEGAALDVQYLADLSDDAVPTLVAAAAGVDDAALQRRLQSVVRCDRPTTGVARWNLAVQRAASARADLCVREA